MPVRRPTQLHSEELEPRCVPATYLWDADGADKNWQTFGNWRILDDDGAWLRTDVSRPGPDDDVVFRAKYGAFSDSNEPCIVNAPAETPLTVRSVEIIENYSRTITIQGAGLRIAGTVPSRMAGYALSRITGGKLILDANTKFTCVSGMLFNTTVEVKSGEGTRAEMIISAPTTGPVPPFFANTTINVHGDLTWKSGNVYTLKTLIHIFSDGHFQITAAEATLGAAASGNPDPSQLKVTNSGHVTLDSTGTATITGDYQTIGTIGLTEVERGTLGIDGNYTSSGTTELSTGTSRLVVAGTTEQTSGWFKLGTGTTVATAFLGIRDGYIVGSGTVEGNLILGYDPLTPDGGLSLPTISPGGGNTASQLGTITVTQNFHMFNGRMDIEIAGPDAYDKIAVTGHAAFTNTATNSARKLEGKLLPVNNVPVNTEFPFLTYSQLGGDFGVPAPDQPITFAGWTWDKNNSQYWFKSPAQNNEAQGRIGGRLFRDDGAEAGVFEPATEGPMVST